MRQRSQFNGPRLTDKLEALLRTRPETPFLAMDGDVVLSKYLTMRACFSRATIYYAVRANPVPDLVALLAAVAGFDISSRHELDLCLSLNIAAEQLSYGNPIKKADEVVCLPCSRRWLPCRSAPAGTS
jgi:ornithine decarboxylase